METTNQNYNPSTNVPPLPPLEESSNVPPLPPLEDSSHLPPLANKEELDKEFTQKEQLDSTYVESYLIQQRRARIALVWKILIVALVGAIIAVSIVIGVRNSKSGVRDKRNKES